MLEPPGWHGWNHPPSFSSETQKVLSELGQPAPRVLRKSPVVKMSCTVPCVAPATCIFQNVSDQHIKCPPGLSRDLDGPHFGVMGGHTSF